MEIRPYGDTLHDGAVQMSFTLPVPMSPEAKEAAKQLVHRMGFQSVSVVHMADAGEGFSFMVVYAKTDAMVDFSTVSVPQVSAVQLSFYGVNDYIRREIGRKVVVLGACTGTDAHTVGLDAIMNMKGYAGEYGLERYPEMVAHNLGSQVPNETLISRAIELGADALLVSQVVTQKDVHIPNLTELVELVEAEGLRDRLVLICGGPRLSHELAIELGYDAGFGSGTLPPHVASFIVQEMVRRGIK
ncbi:MAG: L-beta-lysine 5,6-aminomutase beta subunit [Firmicutes bacterium]|nr:L-beta-lysine 5,6-aminomutase beta subunit [Bacillota bacterium]MBT9152628.1 L-beta-lysine 5,6-aminomutase beta subunit [Bacillota bacterium]